MSDYDFFVELHRMQLVTSAVPEHLWYDLQDKLKNAIFDAGENFLMVKQSNESDDLTVVMKRENGMKHIENNCIYLIDHAWTFEAKDAIIQLRSLPNLLKRMSNIVKLNIEVENDEAVQEVYNLIWKYARAYSKVTTAEEPPLTFWYVMDEFGSCIQHSSTPNFRAVPFYYQAHDAAYTLLFPTRDIDENEEVLIDFVEGVGHEDEKSREALLVPWTGQSFIEESNEQLEPEASYFSSGAQLEDIPETCIPPAIYCDKVMKVYSEYKRVNEKLNAPGFEIINDEDEADILWLTRHFTQYASLNERRPHVLINQFPCERVLTTKDLLAIVSRRGGSPAWLPLTYNLVTELPAFVGAFQRRELAGLDNHWICKPWNLARALDTTVTNNLDNILRLPFSGPKIAQKYAERPVLCQRDAIGSVKFDVRYVVLLVSVSPLKLFVHKKFFLRFANKAFQLNDLWDYEKHFTVMNYRGQSTLHRMMCEDFIPAFESQYPQFTWEAIEKKMLAALKDVFERACAAPAPQGLAHFPQSRALYAADLLLTWDNVDIQPILLEINYGPDCNRACDYYEDFYNDVFNLLFKNIVDSTRFHEL